MPKDLALILGVVIGGLICSLSFLAHFPPWLWLFPVVLYVLPHLIGPLRRYQRRMVTLALALSLAYALIIGLRFF